MFGFGGEKDQNLKNIEVYCNDRPKAMRLFGLLYVALVLPPHCLGLLSCLALATVDRALRNGQQFLSWYRAVVLGDILARNVAQRASGRFNPSSLGTPDHGTHCLAEPRKE